MNLWIRHQDIVPSGRVLRVQAERIVHRDPGDFGLAQLAVLARKTETPVPLLANNLDDSSIFRHIDKLGPNPQSRRQHRRYAQRGKYGQHPFQFIVFRFEMGFLAAMMMESENAPGQKQVDGNENDTRNPERDVDRGINGAPVGGEGREPPGAREVKNNTADDEKNQNDCKYHTLLPVLAIVLCKAVIVHASAR